jgi:hypothetical protein
MRKFARKLCTVSFLILAFAVAVITASCEGSDAKKAIDDTVKDLSGAEIVEKGEKIKQQVEDLTAEDIERIQKDIEKGVYGEDN